MTEHRLKVTFWNHSHEVVLIGRQLADEVTPWHADRDVSLDLGEKIIRDGMWVTVTRVIEARPSVPPKEVTETFLVPPARIREVTLETREQPSDDGA